MDELAIITQQIASDFPGALKTLTSGKKDQKKVEEHRQEFNELKRDIRDTQIGNVQKDKQVSTTSGTKIVKSIRIPIPLQSKIVTTATAFEVGGGIDLRPNEDNDLATEIQRLWRNNRLESKLLELKKLQKSETECAILFTIQDLQANTIFNRMLGKNKNKEIKSRILKSENGQMAPYFDSFGDMIAFTWQFSTTENEKEVKHAWVYTAEKVYKASTKAGDLRLESIEDHGFSKIPVVYLSQDNVEWYISEAMIDRLEVAVSKLGNTNDYVGHPIMKIYGEVRGAPDKNEEGKSLRFDMKEHQDGKTSHGDAEFLTYTHAPESIKLELTTLEKFVYSLTSTPDLSFDNLKGLGNISGVAIKLMFLDAVIKAKMNEPGNRTIIERMINVMISGTVKTTNTGYKSSAENTYFDVVFGSIIPEDVQSAVETLSKAYESGIMSRETAVTELAAVEDVAEEISKIEDSSSVEGE